MPDLVLSSGVARPPIRQQPEDPGQLTPRGAQFVVKAGRTLRVGARDNQAASLELAKALGEDVGCDPFYTLLDLAEPSGPVEQGRDDEQGPPVPHSGQSRGQRG